MIYKAAIDFAREKNHTEIVKLLSTRSSENFELLLKKVKQLESENQHLKSYLIAIKEKTQISLYFYDLSEYEPEAVIGKGATSSVKIVSKTAKEKYAQKELKEFTFESMRRFLSECETLFKLRHPCIVRVYGFNNGDDSHPPSMILSLEPTSLEQAIIDKILDEHQKNRITVELVLGMRYIHTKNFMHRDLKPLNILLSKNNHVRITDFGLAKEEDLETSQSKGVGTMRFMAPELFEENDGATRYTNKVDVYSFGITLLYIVTEKYPDFSLRNVVMGVLPRIQGNIVNWVRELITRCLSSSPDNRPSFAEIFEILKSHNYNLFSDDASPNLTKKQKNLKEEIENRILKIEASMHFE